MKVKFKKMEKMKKREIEAAVAVIVEEAIVKSYVKHKKLNYIEVIVTILATGEKEYKIILMGDEFQIQNEEIKAIADAEYMYRKYMIAKGYSQLLIGNPFI